MKGFDEVLGSVLYAAHALDCADQLIVLFILDLPGLVLSAASAQQPAPPHGGAPGQPGHCHREQHRCGLEFDDQKTAQEVLEGLSHVSDFAYAVVFRAGGDVMAQALRTPSAVPYLPAGERPQITVSSGVLRIDQLVRGKGGGTGTLTLALSLASPAAEERGQTHRLAGCALVFLWAASATVVGTILIGPVRLMTDLALRIADGDLSQPSLEMSGAPTDRQDGRCLRQDAVDAAQPGQHC